ncbi:MAG: hypothetical protein U1E76_07380 [Planctomycetota bacterium]
MLRGALALLTFAATLACCTDGKHDVASPAATVARDQGDDPVTVLLGRSQGDQNVVLIAGPYETSKPRQELLQEQLGSCLAAGAPAVSPWGLQVFNFASSPPRAQVLPAPGQRLQVRTAQREFHDRALSLSPKQSMGRLWLAMQGSTESLTVPGGASIKVLVLMDGGLRMGDVIGARVVTADGAIELEARTFKRADYEAFLNDPTLARLN